MNVGKGPTAGAKGAEMTIGARRGAEMVIGVRKAARMTIRAKISRHQKMGRVL